MSSAREDSLMRLLAQAAAALRRARERLLGASETEALAIEREAGAAIGALFGPQAMLLQAIDVPSAVRLAGGGEKVATWTALLRTQAEARRVGGDDAGAGRLEARATAVEREAAAHFGDDAWAEARAAVASRL
jgi:hypothetical protein